MTKLTAADFAAIARKAILPPKYRWGEDAMEQFNFGKEIAARAIETAAEVERVVGQERRHNLPLSMFSVSSVKVEGGRGFDVSLSNDVQARLRELRLWHWQKALHCRTEGQAFAKLAKVSASQKSCQRMADDWHDKANQHIKFVQTLNDFFPVGDTAEGDAAKEAGK